MKSSLRPHRTRYGFSCFVVALIVTSLYPPCSWAASQYKVLYSFKGGTDGAMPGSPLTFHQPGNLYGSTIAGGINQRDCGGDGGSGCGTVFKLSRHSDGRWTETVLYRFQGNVNGHSDGAGPYGAMVFGPRGSLLGTTVWGGPAGYGVVFDITPRPGGRSTETVLHSFSGADGEAPAGGLSSDSAGNFYGTTVTGGTVNGGFGGVAFKVAHHFGNWSEGTLYTFCSQQHCSDGAFPTASLLQNRDGSLFGTTSGGGEGSPACVNGFGCGTVFKLVRDLKGKWKEKVLHAFTPAEGSQPQAGLVADSKGNLYGTTTINGPFGYGTVFELCPGASKGRWKYRVLYSFRSGTYLGSGSSKLVFDAAGSL